MRPFIYIFNYISSNNKYRLITNTASSMWLRRKHQTFWFLSIKYERIFRWEASIQCQHTRGVGAKSSKSSAYANAPKNTKQHNSQFCPLTTYLTNYRNIHKRVLDSKHPPCLTPFCTTKLSELTLLQHTLVLCCVYTSSKNLTTIGGRPLLKSNWESLLYSTRSKAFVIILTLYNIHYCHYEYNMTQPPSKSLSTC